MKRSRKRRKRRLLLLWSVKSLPIFWIFFCFCVGNFGGVSCWRLGVVLWVVLDLVEVWLDLLRPDLFLWCRNAAGIARWMKMSLKWVSGSSTRCNWLTSRRHGLPALLHACNASRRIGWPVLPQHSKVKAGWWMDLKVDVNNLWLHINYSEGMMGARLLAPSVSQALPLADLNWLWFRWGRFCIEKNRRINSFGDQHERRISMLKFIWETPRHHTSSRIY